MRPTGVEGPGVFEPLEISRQFLKARPPIHTPDRFLRISASESPVRPGGYTSYRAHKTVGRAPCFNFGYPGEVVAWLGGGGGRRGVAKRTGGSWPPAASCW